MGGRGEAGDVSQGLGDAHLKHKIPPAPRSFQRHQNIEYAAAWEKLSIKNQDRERSSSPINLCPALADQQKPEEFPGLFVSGHILFFCNSFFQK